MNEILKTHCNKQFMQKIQNPKLSKKVQGKVNILVLPISQPFNSLYKPSVKMVSWKYFQIYFMHMSAFLYLFSFFMFVDVTDIGDIALRLVVYYAC